MNYYCTMDDGWPKKRCRVTVNKKTGEPKCRHWLKGITKENGCGAGMWKIAGKDGHDFEAFYGKTVKQASVGVT